MPSSGQPSLLISASSLRSGSTWVQRIVHAATDLFVWGESFPLVQFLSYIYLDFQQYAPVRSQETEGFLSREQDPALWVANMNPTLNDLEQGMRALFAQMYRNTHERTGYAWKEVRYGRDDLEFLWKLFPDLRVILLVRSPVDVVRSLRGVGWIDRDGRQNAQHVCREWRARTADYVALKHHPQVLLLRYEDVTTRVDDLLRFVGGQSSDRVRQALDAKVGGAPAAAELSEKDMSMIVSTCGNEMRALGYDTAGIAPSQARDPAAEYSFPASIPAPEIHRLADQYPSVRRLEEQNRMLRTKVVGLEQEIKRLSDNLRERSQSAAELATELAARESRLHSLETELSACVERSNALVGQLGEQKRLIEPLSSHSDES
ncbi:MAG: sulfotransferase [Chloroflexi bacterium]|nr:sulfotransferase [Chloroflexota bacterium]